MLLDPQNKKETAATVAFFKELEAAKSLPRADLVELARLLAGGTPPGKTPVKLERWIKALDTKYPDAKKLAVEAGKDLAAIVPELPDGSLAADWTYLCKQMAKDLGVGAKAALARLADVRKRIVQTRYARIVVTGSTANQGAIAADIEGLVATIGTGPERSKPAAAQPLRARLAGRDAKAKQPTFVGLVAPSTSSGVFLNQAPNVYYTDTADAQVADYLASNLYTGHGAHSIFMKTWAAGLAYSNGLRPRLSDGVLNYYAERCPLLPQTLRFVIDELKKAKPDPNIARYAIATAFDSRIASGFESRAAAMAANLADGLTPDVVKAFRTRVLELAKQEGLAKTLFDRLQPVYSKVLPGFGALDPTATHFVIGPEKQMAAYQDYLKAAVGKSTVLYRLYPRDFWIAAPKL
jgi:hypothetical protein